MKVKHWRSILNNALLYNAGHTIVIAYSPYSEHEYAEYFACSTHKWFRSNWFLCVWRIRMLVFLCVKPFCPLFIGSKTKAMFLEFSPINNKIYLLSCILDYVNSVRKKSTWQQYYMCLFFRHDKKLRYNNEISQVMSHDYNINTWTFNLLNIFCV